MRFDSANQALSVFDSYDETLYDESKRSIRKRRTLVVDSFLKVFPFSKIDQSLKQCETFDNVFSEIIHLTLYMTLYGGEHEVVRRRPRRRVSSPTPTARTADFLCSSVSASIKSLIPSTCVRSNRPFSRARLVNSPGWAGRRFGKRASEDKTDESSAGPECV